MCYYKDMKNKRRGMIIIRYFNKLGSLLAETKTEDIDQAIERATNFYNFPVCAQFAAKVQVFSADGHDLTFELSPKGRAWLLTWACQYSQEHLNLVGAKFPRVMVYT